MSPSLRSIRTLRRCPSLVATVTVLLASPPPALAARGEPPVAYTLRPEFTGEALTALRVELRFRGEADGETVFALPDDFAGVADHWRHVADLRIDGAVVSMHADSALRVLRHRPGAWITATYRVTSAYADDPGAGGNPYAGAVIRPGYVAALGEFVFAVPSGRGEQRATFAWRDWPDTWTRASDADVARTLTVNGVVESTLLAGTDVVVRTRPIADGVLRFAARGAWSFDLDRHADLMARIVSAERRFWGRAGERVRGAYTVTLLPLAGQPGVQSSGGTGRGDGFAMYSTATVPEPDLLYTIAHEHSHTWVPGRIGRMPEQGERALYWLSEGFTEVYAARTLLQAGIWTARDFVDDLNEKLAWYATSPVRAVPNARVVEDFWKDQAVQQLPYRRGLLFGLLLDHALVRAEGARGRAGVAVRAARDDAPRGLDAVVLAMQRRWAAAPDTAKPPMLENFLAATDALGLDARPLLARHIEEGVPIELPPDLFGACAEVRTLTVPTFDVGFDRAKSAETGIITGVDPAGPAYAAGLRDGMRRLGREGGKEGDSRVPIGYRVRDDAGERLISWRPEGKARVALQEVTYAAPGTPADAAACARRMAGTALP